MLVVGGTAEMRQSHPDHIRLVLKERRGFVKLALETGADLGKEKNDFLTLKRIEFPSRVCYKKIDENNV